jgi:hypothetical protein
MLDAASECRRRIHPDGDSTSATTLASEPPGAKGTETTFVIATVCEDVKAPGADAGAEGLRGSVGTPKPPGDPPRSLIWKAISEEFNPNSLARLVVRPLGGNLGGESP